LIQLENLYVLNDYIGQFWMTTQYHPFYKNCNSFAYIFTKLLLGADVCFPSYINRFVQTYSFFENMYENLRVLMAEEDNPSNIETPHVMFNNLTNELTTKNKNTENIPRNEVINTKVNEILKLNENYNLSSFVMKKDLDDEDSREFLAIKKDFDVLIKLNIIETNLVKNILVEIENIICNKLSLSPVLFVDIISNFYAAISLSQKHSKQNEHEKAVLLNQVLEECNLFLKRLIEKHCDGDIFTALNHDTSEINFILVKMNLKIFNQVSDRKAFLTHCNKIFNEVKGAYEENTKNFSNLSNSDMKLYRVKNEDLTFLFNRKYKMNQ